MLKSNFFSKVLKTRHCWYWMGYVDKSGYGKFQKGKWAHRFSWEIKNKRKIPKKKVIMHICNLKICVNPKHLKLGTYRENSSMFTPYQIKKYQRKKTSEYRVNHQLFVDIKANPSFSMKRIFGNPPKKKKEIFGRYNGKLYQ